MENRSALGSRMHIETKLNSCPPELKVLEKVGRAVFRSLTPDLSAVIFD